ncbi:LmbU family transcriptional regulator [Actinoplanes siamensis]|uniref:Antibiotic biosynthesis protein n=1 Tax=Actinoplanes siamensis TaxID=1223317 RepID=A0A919NEI1_9ACTN|nr:LmbU family transcriptional regulator [Actinoplanes siamensis]GIF09347.1 hypothetical protein Asi03nite_68850 [Actinoplanes siamensis]
MTRTTLALPNDLPIESWSSIGDHLLSVSDSSSWWIGDWLVFGQEQYKDRYRRAIKGTALNYQTLRNYAWIARRFEPARRRARLTFQHHVEVAALPPHIQDHWFGLAEKFGWSKNELRKQIRDSESSSDTPIKPTELRVSLRLRQEHITRWEEAARRNNRSLIEWITEALDNATVALDH